MAIYEVEGPDGSTYEIEAPDGATEEQILAFAKSQYTPRLPAGGPLSRNSPRNRNPIPRASTTPVPAEEIPNIFQRKPDILERLDGQTVPRPDNASVSPRMRSAVEHAWNTGDEKRRAELERHVGDIGEIAAGLRARAATVDNRAFPGAGLTAEQKIDPRIEMRTARLAGQGVDPTAAPQIARNALDFEVAPGQELTGTASKSDFDFDRAQEWETNPALNNPIARGVVKGGAGILQGAAGFGEAVHDWVGSDLKRSDASSRLAGFVEEVGTTNDPLGRNFEGAVSSIAQQLPALIGGVITGSEALVLASMALQTFGQEYANGSVAGLSIEQRTKRAALFGAAEAVGEKFGLRGWLDKLHDATNGIGDPEELAKFLAGQLRKEIPGELLTTNIQFAADKSKGFGLNQGAGLEEYLQQTADTIVQTVMQGGLMGGAVAGTAAITRGNEQRQAEAARTGALGKWSAFGESLAGTKPATTSFTPSDSLVAKAGITPIEVPGVSASEPVAAEVPTADLTGGYPTPTATDEDLLAKVDATAPANSGAVPAITPDAAVTPPQAAPEKTWYGRRGDGYQTELDAQQALPGRQRMFRDLDWKVEPSEGGKYRIAGYPRNGVTQSPGNGVETTPAGEKWQAFSPDTGTLGIPRAEMPQIKAEHRGAMVNFLNARGIAHQQETVDPNALKPTQAEFSPEKVATARSYEGGQRSILVSSDGHVLDGHHQWLAAKEAGTPVNVIKLDAPIKSLVETVKEMPSAQLAGETDDLQAGNRGYDSRAAGGSAPIESSAAGVQGVPGSGDGILQLPAKQGRIGDTPASRRLFAQQYINRYIAANPEYKQRINFNAPGELTRPLTDKQMKMTSGDLQSLRQADDQVAALGEALGSAWGGNLTGFYDDSPESVNGVQVGDHAFVNVANLQHSAGHTAFHENYHLIERIAKLDQRAGRHGSAANRFVSSMENLFDDMSDTGKAFYLTEFLRREEFSALRTGAERDAFVQNGLRDKELKSEMVADFFGNRGRDKKWLRDLAKADPEGFGDFVKKWLDIITNLVKQLRGSLPANKNHAALVDTYITGLEGAKAVAREALIKYRRDSGMETALAAQNEETDISQQRRAYEAAPNSLMGFKRNGPQTPYSESNYKHEITVRVSFSDGDTFIDGMNGLNKAHAMERARRNWDGADIELVADEAYSDPQLSRKQDELRVKNVTPAVRQLLKSLTQSERRKITDKTAAKIIEQIEKLPDHKEMAAVAQGGVAKRGWYRKSAEAITAVFEQDAPRFAALLAAMSPQTSVENNLTNALHTWKNWIAAGRPTEREAIIDVMGASVQGSKGRDSVLDAWINNSVRALTSEDPVAMLLSGPKVNSFYRNLIGDVNEVTNDAWMANYALVDQTIFSGSLNVLGTDPGKGTGYLAMSAVTRRAAEYLTKTTGETWTPAEVQETVWSWAKTLYEAQVEGKTAPEVLKEGGLTDELINSTPDFSTLFHDSDYAKILENAGYGKQLNELASTRRSDGAKTLADARTTGEAGETAAEARRRLQLRAAKRLAKLKQQRDADSARNGGDGREEGGGPAPLEGAPSVRGAAGPDARLVKVAERYARSAGIKLTRQSKYHNADPYRGARIAAAYEAMQHAPQDPVVREAYENLIRQTTAQYQALAKAGYKFWFIDLNDDFNKAYVATPWNAMRDLRANKSMGVFPTESGFGSSDLDVSANPLLADTGIEWPVGSLTGPKQKVLANDLFRAVHDAFGHGLEGAGFRADGEENAWQAHARLFTGSALGALTSETRGQNSWLNFGPHGEHNRTAKTEDTIFADQKTGLMPEWTWTEGRDEPQLQRRQRDELLDKKLSRVGLKTTDDFWNMWRNYMRAEQPAETGLSSIGAATSLLSRIDDLIAVHQNEASAGGIMSVLGQYGPGVIPYYARKIAARVGLPETQASVERIYNALDGSDAAGGGRAGAVAGVPSYGTAIEGSAPPVSAVHYSNTARETLESGKWGAGRSDSARRRVENANDDRLRHRIYFYADSGNGIDREMSVGTVPHRVTLNNLYDASEDKLGLFAGKSANDAESAVLYAGFDGYLAPFGKQKMAVLLGKRAVQVQADDAPALQRREVPSNRDPEGLKSYIDEATAAGEIMSADYKYLKDSFGSYLENTYTQVFVNPYLALDRSSGAYDALGEHLYWNQPRSALELTRFEKKLVATKMKDHPLFKAAKQFYDDNIDYARKVEALKTKVVKAAAKREQVKAQAAAALDKKMKGDFKPMNDALEAHRVEYVDGAGERAGEQYDRIMKGLEAKGWSINARVPLPEEPKDMNAWRREEWRKTNKYPAQEHQKFLISITEQAPGGDPDIRRPSVTKRKLYVEQSREIADQSYTAWVYKMAEKVGKPVASANAEGNPWFGSWLTVKTTDGGEQAWHTKSIVNYSVYGKAFNQFPSLLKSSTEGDAPAMQRKQADPFEGSLASRNGKLLTVYRGEHGETADGALQTKLGGYTFVDDPQVASGYAQDPNDHNDVAVSPRVVKAQLNIRKPVIHNEDDPFAEMGQVSENLGQDFAVKMAISHSDSIMATNNWQENFADEDSVESLLKRDPTAVNQLYLDAYRLLDDPEFVTEAKRQGFDGAIHMGNGESMDAIEYRVFSPDQVRTTADTDVAFQRRQTETPEFKKWFGDSKVVDAQGKPLVVYHSSVADIDRFKRSRKDIGMHFGTKGQAEDRFALKVESDPYGPTLRGVTHNTIPVYLSIKNPLRLPDLGAWDLFNFRYSKDFADAGFTMQEMMAAKTIPQMRDLIEAHGFDGIVYKNTGETHGAAEYRKRKNDAWRAVNARFPDQSSFSVEDQKTPEYSAYSKAMDDYEDFRERNAEDSYIAFRPEQIKSAIGNNGQFDSSNPDIAFSRQQLTPAASGPARFIIPGETKTEEFRRIVQDAQLRLRRIQDTVRDQGGVVDQSKDAYQAWELMPGRVEAVVQKFDTKYVTPFIDSLAANKVTPDEIALYAYAMHAPERNADIKRRNPGGVGIAGIVDKRIADAGSGMSNADAKKVLDAVKREGRQAQFDAVYAELRNLIEANRRAMFGYGLITPQEFAALPLKFKNWVPLRGLEHVDHEQDEFAPRRGRGLDIRGAEFMPAMGRISRASSIIENILTDFYQTATRGERNHVNRVLLDLVLANPDSTLWEVDPQTHVREENKKTGLIEGYMKPETRTDVIALKVAGKPVYIRIKDPLMRRALLDEWRSQMNSLPIKVMQGMNTILRNTLTRYNPPFAAANAARDTQQAMAYIVGELGSKAGAKFAATWPKALAAAGRHEFGTPGKTGLFGDPAMDRSYEEFLRSGAITGGFYMQDVEDITRDINRRLVKAGGARSVRGFRDAVSLAANTKLIGGFATPAQVLKLVEAAGILTENATRFALFHAARQSGATRTTAASIAKNGTTNFNRKGEWGPMMGTLWLFANASIQGARGGLHSILKSKHRGQVAAIFATWIGLGTAFALWGAAAGGDDDNGEAYWDLISPEEKRRNWIIMLPPGDALFEGAVRVGARGRYIKIPMPYLFNMFPVMGMGIADAIRHKGDRTRGQSATQAMSNVVVTALDSLNPVGGAIDTTNTDATALALLPTIGDIPYQFINDVGPFGSPTSPTFKSIKVPDHESVFAGQAGGWGHRTAQWLYNVTDPLAQKIGSGESFSGRGISIKPGTIENSVYTLTGGTGRFVGDILSTTLHLIDDQNPLTPNSVPFMNKLYGEVAESQTSRKAYERADKALEFDAIMQKEEGLDDNEPRSAYEEAMVNIAGAAKDFQSDMAKIRKEQINILSDATLSKKDRVAQAQELKADMDEAARTFNETYLDNMRDLGVDE